MNQAFSFNRWLLLVMKHWSENRKKYLLSLGAIAALLLIWMGLCIAVNGRYRPLEEEIQMTTYYVGLFLIGCLYASLLFGDLSAKSKGIEYLLVPASHLEKLLCNLLFGVLLFFICYTVIFYMVDVPMVKLSNSIAADRWLKAAHEGSYTPQAITNVFKLPGNPDPDKPNVMLFILLCYFAVQSAFLLGSVYFPKYSFIKTVIILLLFGALMITLLAKILNGMMPQGNYTSLTSYRIYEPGSYMGNKVVQLPVWLSSMLTFLLKFAFAPIFWVITYFRLKEKQI